MHISSEFALISDNVVAGCEGLLREGKETFLTSRGKIVEAQVGSEIGTALAIAESDTSHDSTGSALEALPCFR